MEQERKGWFVTAIVLMVCSWLLLCCLSACRSKPAAQASPTRTIVVMDTTRTRLVHRADDTGKTVLILHERNSQKLTDYDHAAAVYDSTVVHLR